MKKTLVLSTEQLRDACAMYLRSRAETAGMVIAQVALVADPDEEDKNLQIRAHAVLFDTEAAAREYLNPTKEKAENAESGK